MSKMNWHVAPPFHGQDFYCSHLLWATSQATNVAKMIFYQFYPFFDIFFPFFMRFSLIFRQRCHIPQVAVGGRGAACRWVSYNAREPVTIVRMKAISGSTYRACFCNTVENPIEVLKYSGKLTEIKIFLNVKHHCDTVTKVLQLRLGPEVLSEVLAVCSCQMLIPIDTDLKRWLLLTGA